MNGIVKIGLMVFGVIIAVATGMYFFNGKCKKYMNDLWYDLSSKDDGCCKPEDVKLVSVEDN